jgi:hypothetical protein
MARSRSPRASVYGNRYTAGVEIRQINGNEEFRRAPFGGLLPGNYVNNWISGTATILDSDSRRAEDAARRGEEAIDNIERLIA